MEVPLPARCVMIFAVTSVLVDLNAAVQPQAAHASSLSMDSDVRSRRRQVQLTEADARTTEVHGPLEPNSSAEMSDSEHADMHEHMVSGHIDERGVYIADSPTELTDSRRSNSRSVSPTQVEVAQPSLMRKESKQRKSDSGKHQALEDAEDAEHSAEQDDGEEDVSLVEAENSASTEEDSAWFTRRRRRRAVHCRFTEWQKWSPCSKNCGGGSKQRSRGTVGPHHGGKVCSGPSMEYKTCNLQNCAVDCEWNSWGAWGPCSQTCDGGQRVRYRSALPFTSMDGGVSCDSPAMASKRKQSASCNTQKCPVPCKFAKWSLWGGCSKTCGTGMKRRTRQKIAQLHGGAPCKGETVLEEKCNAIECPVDCLWKQWGGWGKCSRTCGGGMKLRERLELRQASNGGKACLGSPAEILACNVQDCPQDCKWAEWHAPSPCSKTCGGGSFTRHRARVQQAMFGGAECHGPSTEVGPCNVEPCAVDCKYEDWQPWGECSISCGGGVHKTTRTAIPATNGGIACLETNKTKEEACNTQACPAIQIKAGSHRQAHHHLAVLAFSFLMVALR